MATWTEDIIAALERLGGTGTYSDIYREVESARSGMPVSWQFIIQREIQRHSSQSSGWEGRRDLFFSVDGIGQGVWGLRVLIPKTPLAADLPTEDFAVPSGNDLPARVETVTYRVLRDTNLARKIKLIHRNECQLCGLALAFPNGGTYSEAHHIIPLGSKHAGPDTAGNIIVLCPNHHALCDVGAIPLSREDIRARAGHEISEVSLRYHNETILVGVG